MSTLPGDTEAVPSLLMPVSEGLLSFRVAVPAGCEVVLALRTPSGQLVELTDLVAEDAGGIEVGRVPAVEVAVDPLGEVTFAVHPRRG